MQMYPALAATARRLQAEKAVVDGEIVAVDKEGRPSFQALQHRGSHPDHTIVFYAFDLLHLNGEDTRALPFEARRAKLAPVVEKSSLLLSLALPGSVADIVDTSEPCGSKVLSPSARTRNTKPGSDLAIGRS